MGYESRLYVVEKSNSRMDDRVWAEVIATFNLSKAGLDLLAIRQFPDTDCYIYEDTSDYKIVEDAYGKPLKEIPISDMIKIIQKEAEKDQYHYRRWKPCLALLEGFDESQWDNIKVLHYGY